MKPSIKSVKLPSGGSLFILNNPTGPSILSICAAVFYYKHDFNTIKTVLSIKYEILVRKICFLNWKSLFC